MRKILTSGDVRAILEAWRRSIERVMYPETMAPLMIATAYASHGWNDAARTALGRAAKGPAWEAAREQRLFVEQRVVGVLGIERVQRLFVERRLHLHAGHGPVVPDAVHRTGLVRLLQHRRSLRVRDAPLHLSSGRAESRPS